MAGDQNQARPQEDLNHVLQARRDKLAELQESGKDPFQITKYDQTHHSTEVKEHYQELEGREVSVAGRMMFKRVMGKASFCNIQDLQGRIQIYVAKDSVGEEEYKDFKKLDIGDIIGITGTVFIAHIDPAHLKEAQDMAEKVTRALTGAGLWGVEFFLSHENGVYFSELSPRPHDTGMVTLAGTQNLNEFELHCRAVLGLPIPGIKQERIGASAVILSPIASQERPNYRGMEEVTKEEDTYLRIFGKPTTRVNRRMGVVLCYAPLGSDLDTLRDKAKRIADKIEVY